MKKTQLRDALGNIRANIVSFISIIFIAMLAALMYLSIVFTARALSDKASDYYAQTNMWDLELTSTYLLDDEDLQALRAVPGVESVEPSLQISAELRYRHRQVDINLTTITEQVSVPELVEGRMPQSASECLVEEQLVKKLGVRAGDSIEIENGAISEMLDELPLGELEETLGSDFTIGGKPIDQLDPIREKTLKITGVFRHPDHISFQVPATPYVLVLEDCFDKDVLMDSFMLARIRVEGTPADRYGKQYAAAVAPVKAALEAMADERAAARTERLRARFDEQLEDGQRQLDESRLQLDDALKKLEEAQRTLEAGRQELAEAAEKLGIGKGKLDDGLQQLQDAMLDVEEGADKLRKGKELLDKVESHLSEGINWIKHHVTEDEWPSDAPITYAEFLARLDSGTDKIMAWLYEATGYNAGLAKLNYARALVEQGRIDWYYGGEEYLDGVTLYERGRRQLEEGEQQYADGQQQYADGLERWEEGLRKLQKARKLLDGIENGRWILLDNNANAGYVFARMTADNLSSLSLTFSLLFMAVAALVIYSTVGRMVEEQGKLVGATKAMGLYNREIFLKYLLFGMLSTLLGLLLGIVLSHGVLQPVLLKVYGNYFTYGPGPKAFLLLPTLLVILGGGLLALVSVWLACTRLLREPAIRLMQGAVQTSKLKKANRSAKRSLYSRMILLNMRTDLKRVIVTIVSVAGCCVLLMVGFTLKYAIGRVAERQYGQIMTYDARVIYKDPGNGEEPGAAIARYLRDNGLTYSQVINEQHSFSADGVLSACTLIVAEPSELEGYYSFRDPETKETLTLSEHGLLIPLRMQELYDMDPGETFTINDKLMVPYEVSINGVYENYFGFIAFCTPAGFEEIFGQTAKDNCFLIKQCDDLRVLEAKLMSLPGFVTLEDAQGERERFEDLSKVLDLLIAFMVLMAVLLAFFIVLNLSNTFISQKSRELTIMRINGFTTGECIRYVSYDLIITTLAGIALGLVVGMWMGDLISRRMEQTYFIYVRDPDVRSFVFSFLITALISLGINSIALRKIKHLKLSDLS